MQKIHHSTKKRKQNNTKNSKNSKDDSSSSSLENDWNALDHPIGATPDNESYIVATIPNNS